MVRMSKHAERRDVAAQHIKRFRNTWNTQPWHFYIRYPGGVCGRHIYIDAPSEEEAERIARRIASRDMPIAAVYNINHPILAEGDNA